MESLKLFKLKLSVLENRTEMGGSGVHMTKTELM